MATPTRSPLADDSAPAESRAEGRVARERGSILARRYLLVAELGRGAEGVVYHARDLRLGGRSVAVKTLLPGAPSRPERLEQFATEANVLCRITHPNVPVVLDHGPCERGYFIAFPLIRGRTLEQMTPDTGAPDVRGAVRLAARLARVLHFLWSELGILHLDVKPANVLLPDGDPEMLYLSDFGLAVVRNAGRSGPDRQGIRGTPAYLSPERARGEDSRVGHATDIYAVGVLLFRLLTGRVPFPAGYPRVLRDIQFDPAPAPSSLRAGLHPALDTIVARALAKAPEERFGTGLRLAEELERCLDGHRLSPAPNPYTETGHEGRRPWRT